MAKFKNDSLDLETGEHIDFDDGDTISMGYDGAELYISSTVSGVAAVQPYHIVILSQLEDAIGGVTVSGGGGIFGSYYAYAKSDGSSSTNSTSFVTKVSLTTDAVVSGTYKINWYSEMQRNSQANDMRYRIYLDGTTELCNINFELSDQSGWLPLSGYDVVTLTSGSHTIAVQFCGETTGNTSYIRRSRVDISRIS
jgi:hypothetical protein